MFLVVDFEAFVHYSLVEIERVVRDIDNVFLSYGFVYLEGHGIHVDIV